MDRELQVCTDIHTDRELQVYTDIQIHTQSYRYTQIYKFTHRATGTHKYKYIQIHMDIELQIYTDTTGIHRHTGTTHTYDTVPSKMYKTSFGKHLEIEYWGIL